MAIDTSASHVATNALQAIPFGSIIGGPLKACVDAQALAAQTTWEFVQKVGLQTDKDGNTKAINVRFEYIQGGRAMVLIVPLLTIVPIPYIAIDEIDINFKAKISASSSSSSEKSSSTSFDAGVKTKASVRTFFVKASAEMHANISSKKDSKATQESKYSVEYTMDVHVHAGQDGMPAGMAKVLEILSSSVDTVNAKGELSISDSNLTLSSNPSLVASYRSAEGVLEPQIIGCRKDGSDKVSKIEEGKNSFSNSEFTLTPTDNGESIICTFKKAGSYYIEADKCKTLVVVGE